MRVSAAIGRGCCYAEWSKLPDALRVRKVHIGLQIRQSWPAVPVSDSRMKRKARSDTEVARKRAAARQVPNPPGIDYREHPELYKVARGEQGVLTVEPYKSEILPHWRFRYMYEQYSCIQMSCCMVMAENVQRGTSGWRNIE